MFQDILILRQHPLFHSHCIIYLLIPTSNHNDFVLVSAHGMLYIFWFLHQTTTGESDTSCLLRCISFDSYIKPQLVGEYGTNGLVVFLLIPTSNHNDYTANTLTITVVYLLIPTSNHNVLAFDSHAESVVYLLIPTSNHNFRSIVLTYDSVVYLLIPTSNHNCLKVLCRKCLVVYLLIPTSNHNLITASLMRIRVVYLLIPTSNHNAEYNRVIN